MGPTTNILARNMSSNVGTWSAREVKLWWPLPVLACALCAPCAHMLCGIAHSARVQCATPGARQLSNTFMNTMGTWLAAISHHGDDTGRCCGIQDDGWDTVRVSRNGVGVRLKHRKEGWRCKFWQPTVRYRALARGNDCYKWWWDSVDQSWRDIILITEIDTHKTRAS